MRNLLSMDDLTTHDVRELLDLAHEAKRIPRRYASALEDASVLLVFAKPSVRTRLSFEIAVEKMGGHAISYDLASSTVGTKESWRDLARTASRYVDAIVARLFAQRDLEEIALASEVPVVNGLTDVEHPCQALADLFTLEEKRGLADLTIAYVGDANNNVTHSLLFGAAKMGVNVRVGSPPDMEPDEEILASARKQAEANGAEIDVVNEAYEAVRGADVVYTDTWMSYHVPAAERKARVAKLTPFRVDADLMARAAPDALFMHCLPATRGEEVTEEVLESKASVVFDQAENRLHTEKALLLKLVAPAELHRLP